MAFFQRHKDVPKRDPAPKRGGPYVDAIRSLTDERGVKSVSFEITDETPAITLRTRLAKAASNCGVRIQITTAEGRVYASLKQKAK